jgi:GntR family transcriptional regulator
MWFHIDPSSGTPIYRQIMDQIRQGVASGVLRPGDRLPSVRELAVELAVNPNTIAKAYQELEREGTIETPRGRGTFVAGQDRRLPIEERLRQFEEAVGRLVAEAYRLQIDPDTVVALVRDRLAEAERRRSGG